MKKKLYFQVTLNKYTIIYTIKRWASLLPLTLRVITKRIHSVKYNSINQEDNKESLICLKMKYIYYIKTLPVISSF